MLITSHNDNLMMFSENITVILKVTIDYDGTPVPHWFFTVNVCQCSFTLAKRSVETSGFTMSKCMYYVYYFL